MIYLDYAATSPMTAKAIEAYSEVAKRYYGNSASLHDLGGQAHHFVEQARAIIANALQVKSDGVIFTGSGTEGNILAILSLAMVAKKGKHIISSQAEHTSVHAALNTLEKMGYRITKLPLKSNGCISVEQLREAIEEETSVISIQHVNSEIGSIQPIADIAHMAKQANILLHVDCVQSFCKVPLQVQVDALTVSAHKIGGPKGCGAIYINPTLRVPALTPGVTHERGLRGGTLDTPAIVAFATAVEEYKYEQHHYEKLRQFFKQHLPKNCCLIESEEQLPTICGIVMRKVEGQYVLLKLNEAGICISTGSACDIHSDSGTKAILSMGYSVTEARQFFRISFGPSTTIEQLETVQQQLSMIDYERFI
ncbi:cysteine desulfurase family protein [Lysinibacillus piscis]|uniref:Cysteine desulfurase n=1 Tax=Lysinibacillus piscis TaxID=2518931 RepID=A0ABQ5NR47_9BACI|nr:IscS subfamily cysteine desulfurase [Lysinibacillus sp. KH24]GLC90591.1 cysteine desulfurase [Lysinibacillus sp. KH24]